MEDPSVMTQLFRDTSAEQSVALSVPAPLNRWDITPTGSVSWFYLCKAFKDLHICNSTWHMVGSEVELQLGSMFHTKVKQQALNPHFGPDGSPAKCLILHSDYCDLHFSTFSGISNTNSSIHLCNTAHWFIFLTYLPFTVEAQSVQKYFNIQSKFYAPQLNNFTVQLIKPMQSICCNQLFCQFRNDQDI